MAASGENNIEATQHSRPQESGTYQTRFYLLFIFVSGYFFSLFPCFFSIFPPVCHQSLVSAASLQWKGRQSQAVLLEGEKEDH